MTTAFGLDTIALDAAERRIHIACRAQAAPERGDPPETLALGWQVFDPESGLFLQEGEWQPFGPPPGTAEWRRFTVEVAIPPEDGAYRIYVSLVGEESGWFYARDHDFLIADVEVADGQARLLGARTTTLARLNWRNRWRSMARAMWRPAVRIWINRSLIRTMVRRDIQARYRGSFGDFLWTVLNPLLLMATYYFVFGVVLRTRFGNDPSRSGFVLYFLAGMLPWLALSEAAGRAPTVVLEYRNFVKKLLFPLEILPVNLVLSGLVTGVFALVVFVVFLLVARGAVPWTVVWLPVLLVPQILLTLGVCWFLATLGVFVRDLAQIIGFLLTLWFFVTPICYPEESLNSLPAWALAILTTNPLHVLVRGYRAIFLEAKAPDLPALAVVALSSLVLCLAGQMFFDKFRKSFADVI